MSDPKSNRNILIVIAVAVVIIAAALVLPPLFKGAAEGAGAAADAANSTVDKVAGSVNTEWAIGNKLARESRQYISDSIPGATAVTEVPPGKDQYGAPENQLAGWGPGYYNIWRSGGKENINTYVEYTYVDAVGVKKRIFLRHNPTGSWDTITDQKDWQ